MKWFFVLFLAIIIFGGAAWFGYNFVFKEDIQVRKEQRGDVAPEARLDLTLPEFEAAAKLRQEGKIPEARAALTAFVQKYPTGQHAEEAKDLLGEVNVDILLSRTPSPEKEEYVVKPGDVLQKVAHKVKSTPELIMRMNNLNGTMLHIGEHLLISHPDFAVVVQRKPKLLVLLNHGGFFKQYHLREEKLPAKSPSKVTTKVVEIMAWNNGKRVGYGSKSPGTCNGRSRSITSSVVSPVGPSCMAIAVLPMTKQCRVDSRCSIHSAASSSRIKKGATPKKT